MTDDDFSSSPNPRRLYRDKQNGVISGVCAGLAEYFNIDVALVRIATVVGLFVSAGWVLFGYIIAAFVIPTRPRTLRQPLSEEEDQFWRGVSRRPEMTFSNIKYRFRDMNERLANIEQVVTSEEWKLRRQFREIE